MSTALDAGSAHQARRLSKHAGRKRTNAIALVLALAAMSFGLFWLIWILIETVRLGLGGIALSLFTEMTPPPQADGGLANAIVGSLLMVSLATALGTPIGILAGVYLAESTDTLGVGYQLVVPYLIMLLVLFVRPYGLFGTEEIRRV